MTDSAYYVDNVPVLFAIAPDKDFFLLDH
jgi:hypothetical protein